MMKSVFWGTLYHCWFAPRPRRLAQPGSLGDFADRKESEPLFILIDKWAKPERPLFGLPNFPSYSYDSHLLVTGNMEMCCNAALDGERMFNNSKRNVYVALEAWMGKLGHPERCFGDYSFARGLKDLRLLIGNLKKANRTEFFDFQLEALLKLLVPLLIEMRNLEMKVAEIYTLIKSYKKSLLEVTQKFRMQDYDGERKPPKWKKVPRVQSDLSMLSMFATLMNTIPILSDDSTSTLTTICDEKPPVYTRDTVAYKLKKAWRFLMCIPKEKVETYVIKSPFSNAEMTEKTLAQLYASYAGFQTESEPEELTGRIPPPGSVLSFSSPDIHRTSPLHRVAERLTEIRKTLKKRLIKIGIINPKKKSGSSYSTISTLDSAESWAESYVAENYSDDDVLRFIDSYAKIPPNDEVPKNASAESYSCSVKMRAAVLAKIAEAEAEAEAQDIKCSKSQESIEPEIEFLAFKNYKIKSSSSILVTEASFDEPPNVRSVDKCATKHDEPATSTETTEKLEELDELNANVEMEPGLASETSEKVLKQEDLNANVEIENQNNTVEKSIEDPNNNTVITEDIVESEDEDENAVPLPPDPFTAFKLTVKEGRLMIRLAREAMISLELGLENCRFDGMLTEEPHRITARDLVNIMLEKGTEYLEIKGDPLYRDEEHRLAICFAGVIRSLDKYVQILSEYLEIIQVDMVTLKDLIVAFCDKEEKQLIQLFGDSNWHDPADLPSKTKSDMRGTLLRAGNFDNHIVVLKRIDAQSKH